jgi:hypothetical protein
MRPAYGGGNLSRVGEANVARRVTRIEIGIELMPDGQHPESQQCALPGCDETIAQPECGGPRRLYCSYDHRATARRLRSIARFEAAVVPAQAVNGRNNSPEPHKPRRVPPQERKSSIAVPWITDPFSLPPNLQRHGGRMPTGAAE